MRVSLDLQILFMEGPYMRKYGSYKLDSMLMGLFFCTKKNAINSHKGFVSVGFLIKRPFKLRLMYKVPYQRHHKLLLITSRSWIQAIHKDRIFWKNLLKNKEMVFENGLKNIQAAAYNGARTVCDFLLEKILNTLK